MKMCPVSEPEQMYSSDGPKYVHILRNVSCRNNRARWCQCTAIETGYSIRVVDSAF